MASESKDSIVARFQNIGIEDTPENLMSVRSTIMEVCEAFPE